LNKKYQNNNKKVLLHLSLIFGVGPASIIRILKYLLHRNYPGLSQDLVYDYSEFDDKVNLEQLYFLQQKDFVKKIGISELLSQDLVNGLADKKLLEEELEVIKKIDANFITVFNEDYPDLLKQIHLPPIILWLLGNKNVLSESKKLAIVGSRTADCASKNVINEIVPKLIENNVCIVSGGALGADSMAHQVTLENSGKTIAVLGSGLDNQYPAKNISFFKEIVTQRGLIISPFHCSKSPDKSTFPARNRIIAGLSFGTLVTQAAKRSGALITADFALEQGRQVFAVPGSLENILSEGCHNLIKQGAKLVTCVDDIFVEAPYLFEGVVKKNDNVVEIIKKTISVNIHEKKDENSDSFLNCMGKKVITFDELLERSGLAMSDLQSKLFDLQIQGKIKQTFNGSWQKV
jgi:DNA processing protein